MDIGGVKQVGVNEAALQTEIERFGLEATEDNPAGIVTDFVEGQYQVADDQANCLVSPGAIVGLLEALRAIPTEDGPDFFWQTVADFEEKGNKNETEFKTSKEAQDIEYWTHTPDGETYAVMPEAKQCFGPLRQEEIGKITEEDERWDNEDWEWLDSEPCVLRED